GNAKPYGIKHTSRRVQKDCLLSCLIFLLLMTKKRQSRILRCLKKFGMQRCKLKSIKRLRQTDENRIDLVSQVKTTLKHNIKKRCKKVIKVKLSLSKVKCLRSENKWQL